MAFGKKDTKTTTPATAEASPETKGKGMSEIGVLWEKTSKNGNGYLNGQINLLGKPVYVKVFATTAEHKAKNPKGPDFRIMVSND